jgi:AraC-like DNA-binding protein
VLYRELSPAPALWQHVRCYWILSAEAVGDPSPQRVLPDGCVEIIINLGAQFVRYDEFGGTECQPRELLVGPTTRHMSIAPTGAIRLVGIRFAPGGAVPFLSVRPAEVRDGAPPLADVALPFDANVVERLALARPRTEGALLDAALGTRLARSRQRSDRRVMASVRATVVTDRPLTVDALVSLTGLGARHLERVFRDTVGFGPKTLCRLARFQRVVRAIEPVTPPQWARLAAGHGYADQSHLAREFREFAGTTLTRYLGELHPMSDHFHDVPGADDSPIG